MHANIDLGARVCEEQGLQKDDGRAIDELLKKLAEEQRFAINQNYVAILREVYEAYPQKARSQANNQMILRACVNYKVPFQAAHFVDLVARDEVWNTLANSVEFEDERRHNRELESMIDYITANRTKGFSFAASTETI